MKSLNKEQAEIVREIREFVKRAVPFSTVFIDGIEQDQKKHVEEQLEYAFHNWANTWIIPRLNKLEGLPE